DVWIAANVLVGQDVVIQRIAVVVAKPIAPIVAAAAILRYPGLCIDQALVGSNAQIAAAEIDRLTRLDRLYPAAALSIGAVDPIVQAPYQAVDAMLLVAFEKPSVQGDALVSFAGAFGVFRIEDLRSAGHERALAPGHYTGGKPDAVEKHRGLGVLAVAVCVFEVLDAAARFAFAVN